MPTMPDDDKRQALPTINAILAYWGKHQDDLLAKTGYLLDRGEPTCWACGDTFDGRFDKHARWSESPLQRCHIVPDALGGRNEPSNFVLMCPQCHDLAPDTASPEILFTWMRSQSVFARKTSALLQAFSDFGTKLPDMPEAETTRLMEIANSADFIAWSKGKVSMHRMQEAGGSAMSLASFVGILLEYANSPSA